MTRRTAIGLLMFCVLGLTASSLSSYVHYRLLHDPGYRSICSVNDTFNCDTVYESRYGAIGGVPVALAGVIWFVGATMLTVGGWPRALAFETPGARKAARRPGGKGGAPSRPTRFADYAPLYLFAWSVIGLAFVLYFAYASFVILKTVCVFCLLTYVAVVGIFILSGTGTDLSMRSLPGRVLRDLRALVTSPAALASAIFFVAFAATAIAFFPRQPDVHGGHEGGEVTQAAALPGVLTPAQQAEFDKYYASQPRVPLPVPNDGAKVVIVKFNDYMCPPCKQTYMEYKPILAHWQATRPGLVKLIVKDYPLDPACNANTPQATHLGACDAAVAVHLARERGRAEEMESWLFQNQQTLTRVTVRQAAREVGRVTNFDERYPSIVELVKGDIALATQVGVRGTPTFYVNGVKIPGLRPEYFNAAIQYELKQAGVQ